jgi:predicted dehydrogenase
LIAGHRQAYAGHRNMIERVAGPAETIGESDMAKGGESSQETRRIRYAVVGLGHISQVAILPAFQHAENSELVALVSDDEKKRQELKQQHGIAKTFTYTEYDECLSSGVDAVYIAVPNHLHKEYAVRAARAGVNVLCEKPMAANEAECREMLEAAEQAGVKLMVAYRLHFEKGNLEAIKIASSGKIGEARYFTSEFSQQVAEGNIRVNYPPEQGGGPVFDMGVYCINAARYLFDDEPVEVLAAAESREQERFSKSEEMTSFILRFPHNRLASITCSFGAADISRYTLVGDEGTLTADPAYEYAGAIKHQLVIGEKKRQRTFAKRDQFAAELVYFSDCILRDKEPEPSGLEGLADVRIVNAIYESARSGKSVRIEPIAAKARPSLAQEIHRPPINKPPKPVDAASPEGEAA